MVEQQSYKRIRIQPLDNRVTDMKSLSQLVPWRVRRQISRYLQIPDPLKMRGIDLVKHTGKLREARSLLFQIRENSNSVLCRNIVGEIEQDKIDTAKALGNMKADPNPLPSTMFSTEAEALRGCATPAAGGKLLFALVRTLKPLNVIEIGAAHGYGALYIGSALRENGRGKLYTLEGMAVRIQMSQAAVARFGLENYVEVVGGDFADTFPRTIQAARPLNMIFSDGNKEPIMTRNQFHMALDVMEGNSHMFFEDINLSRDIALLWQDIVNHERVSSCVTFDRRWGLIKLFPPRKPFILSHK